LQEGKNKMKLKVNANEFCPDNCPFCKVTTTQRGCISYVYCENKDICKYAHSLSDNVAKDLRD